MSGAPPAFADSFWVHLHPRLTRLCIAQARCVAADVETFGGAIAAVNRYAYRFGAGFLPPDAADALRDWILTTLCEEILRAEAGEGGDWANWLKNNNIMGGRAP